MAADPSIGTTIRKRRQVLGMTQDELAGRVGVDRTAISNWERGRHFPQRYIYKLEAVLGITLDGSDQPEYDDPQLQAAWEQSEGLPEERRRAIVRIVIEGRQEHPRVPEELRRRFRERRGGQRQAGNGGSAG